MTAPDDANSQPPSATAGPGEVAGSATPNAVLPPAPPPARPLAGPVTQSERIASIDVLRGFALLGILLMNIERFALPWTGYAPEAPTDRASTLNFGSWIVNELFFEGTMRTIFSMLFGAGVILVTERIAGRGLHNAGWIYYRRTFWLMVIGLFHGFVLLWPGDILFPYGLVGLFLFPFRRLPWWSQIALGLLVLAGAAPNSLEKAADLRMKRDAAVEAESIIDSGGWPSRKTMRAKDEWEIAQRMHDRPAQGDIDFEIEQRREGYRSNFDSLGYQTKYMYVNEMMKTGFWDMGGMMLIGMGLLRLGVFSASRSPRFYLTLALAGYTAGIAINIHETFDNIAHDFELVRYFENKVTYHWGRLFVALGHIGVLMRIYQSGIWPSLVSRLAAVGRMALSNYVLQTVLCTLIFYGTGLGLFGEFERYQTLGVVALVWAVELAISPVWLRYFQFGPLEWLWRSLTYWRPQPMLQRAG